MEAAYLKQWKCHKVVNAGKILEVTPGGVTVETWNGGKIELGNEAFVDRHQPEVGGYFVIYDDGYQSYSPAKAFEEGYAEMPPVIEPTLEGS